MGILYALLVQFYGWAVSSLQYLTSQSAARLVKMQEMAEFYVVNVPNMSDTIPGFTCFLDASRMFDNSKTLLLRMSTLLNDDFVKCCKQARQNEDYEKDG